MSEGENGGAADVKELMRWAEQTQRNLDFMADRQAQFTADLQRFQEGQEGRWRKADETWGRIEASIRALLAVAQIHEGEIKALQEAQDRTDRQIAETGKQLAETGEQLADTGERVDALVNTLERLITERRDGRGKREASDE